MAKSSSDSKAETSPASTPGLETATGRPADVQTVLEIIERRTRQGEYNVDAKDMLAMARVIYNLLMSRR